MADCLSDNEIVQFLEQRASGPVRERILTHIDTCPSCRSLLAESADDAVDSDDALNDTGIRGGVPGAEAELAPRFRDTRHPARIDEIELIRPIGRGAMGEVFLGQDTLLDRKVAVKFMANLEADRERRERFLVEARAIARLSHPNVVTVHRVGEIDGKLYLVSEFIDGQSLASIEKPLAFSDLLRISHGLARGLAAAHKRGVLHRDIKPANAMLAQDGDVKLLDFGLAKLTLDGASPGDMKGPDPSADRSGAGPSGAPSAISLTATGTLLGTPLYIAPEIWTGQAASPASDVYSLGVVFFELASGRTPFLASSLDELSDKVTHQAAPPLQSVIPQVDPRFSTIVDRCLRSEPSERYRSGDELTAALDILVGQVLGARHSGTLLSQEDPNRLTKRRIVWGGLGLSVLALTLSLGASLTSVGKRSVSSGPTPMLPIEGGAFMMGSTKDEVDAAFDWCKESLGEDCLRDLLERELPARQVFVTGFLMDVTEVTNHQFATWLNRQQGLTVRDGRWVEDRGTLLADLYPPYSPWFGIVREGSRFAAIAGGRDKPVTQLTWAAAERYCAAIGRRLPTEAEWEFAARGRGESRFPWGTEEPTCDGVVFGRGPQQRCKSKGPGPHDVGTTKGDVTPQGIRDLGGNMSEWVHDRFSPHYPACGSCQDPRVEERTSNTSLRVVRGGNWMLGAPACRSASRSRWEELGTARNVGFRCVQSVKQ